MAKVENVARLWSGSVHDSVSPSADLFGGSEKGGGIQVTLDTLGLAESSPGLGDVLAPVDADNVGVYAVHVVGKVGTVVKVIDNRDAIPLEVGDDLLDRLRENRTYSGSARIPPQVSKI